MIANHRKLTELEAVRGIAAIVVLVHHSLLAFAPRFEGLMFPKEPFKLFGTPFYGLVNGAASVALFFVLSGFVLTYRMIGSNDLSGLVVAVLKRWPRLAGPVLLVSVASSLLVWFGLYRNGQAAALSLSPWLPWWFTDPSFTTPAPVAAVLEGSFGTFFQGRTFFNGNLWTMHYELFGSFLAFGLAVLTVLLRRPGIALVLNLAIFVWLLSRLPFFATFAAGVILAQLHALWGRRIPAMGMPWLIAASVAAALLLGFKLDHFDLRAVGFYGFLQDVPGIAPLKFQILLHTLAAVLVMAIVMSSAACRRALGGRTGIWLGRMSFPIYLTHLIVICSIGSQVFIALSSPGSPGAYFGSAAMAAVAVTIVVTLLASLPVARFDEWWVRTVNRRAAALNEAPAVRSLRDRTAAALGRFMRVRSSEA